MPQPPFQKIKTYLDDLVAKALLVLQKSTFKVQVQNPTKITIPKVDLEGVIQKLDEIKPEPQKEIDLSQVVNELKVIQGKLKEPKDVDFKDVTFGLAGIAEILVAIQERPQRESSIPMLAEIKTELEKLPKEFNFPESSSELAIVKEQFDSLLEGLKKISDKSFDINVGLPVDTKVVNNRRAMRVSVQELEGLGTLGNGVKTVTSAGTAEALASSTACRSVTIKATAGNTNNIYVGDSSVDSTNGFVLAAGETVSLEVKNLDLVYIDADTSTEGVSYIYAN